MNGGDNSRSVARSTIWTIADFIADRGVGFLIVAILARLITPAEFGTVALLAVFVAVASVMAESGLGLALIQKPEIEDIDIASAFWMNIILACAMTIALWVAGPMIADFFDEPLLVPLVRILALSIPLGALGTVQRSLLLRELAYKKLMIARAITTLLAGLIATGLALAGFGVFALAIQTCAMAAVMSAILWVLSPWRPRSGLDLSSARRLLGFGSYMLASSLLDTVYNRAYTVFIGNLGSSETVGLYGRADATITLVQGFVAHPLNQLAFPILSRMAGENKCLGEALRTSLRASMLINAPAMLMLPVLAAPLMVFAYGPQWSGAVPFVQILSLVGLLMPLHILNLRALMAQGNSNIFFWLEVGKKIVGIMALFVGANWGAIGVAWAAVIAGLIAAVINSSLSHRMYGYGTLAQAQDILLPVALGLAMAGVAYGSLYLLAIPSSAPLVQLVVGSTAGCLVWLMVVMAFNLSGFRVIALSLLGKKHSKDHDLT